LIERQVTLDWTGDDAFSVGPVAFRAQDVFAPLTHALGDDEFAVFKPRWMVEGYADLLADLQPQNVFELGIFQGGSTVFVATLAEVRKLVAVDLAPAASPAFARWAAQHTDRVSAIFGVDQSDQSTLREILASEFQGEPLDLVVDDASHRLEPSRASFNVLFPHLRPGGLYLIEDWTIPHELEKAQAEQREDWLTTPAANSEHTKTLMTEPPLTLLLLEASLSTAYGNVIEEVSIRRGWASVRRGSDPVDPQDFRISDCYLPGARGLLNRL
jgi:predicted O-methyltransferase YrrM